MSTLLALLASLLWGGADFLGGTASRRLPAPAVIAWSEAIGCGALVVAAVASGDITASPAYLAWAAGAGVVGLVALSAFYVALATGTMGVVAPIAALGVVVPVAVGVGQGDRPGAAQGIGVAVAVLGVVLASGPELRTGPGARAAARRPLLLAGAAALGFGAVIVFVAHGARTSTVMTLLVMRVVTVSIIGALALAGRVRLPVQRTDLPLLAVIGVTDAAANGSFALASESGLLSIVAVLSSLYPAVTVVLARWVHAERISRLQTAGVLATLSGVVLIASGGGVSA